MTITHGAESPCLADDLLLEHITLGLIVNRFNRFNEQGGRWTACANSNAILYETAARGLDIVFDRPSGWLATTTIFLVANHTLYHIASYFVS
jgi:hypothetical protein